MGQYMSILLAKLRPIIMGTRQETVISDFTGHLKDATSLRLQRKKKIGVNKAIFAWQTESRYIVKDQEDNKIFYARERSQPCSRLLDRGQRELTLQLEDMRGQNVLKFDRPFHLALCCGAYRPDTLFVDTPNGENLGAVKERFNLLYPKFKLKDAAKETVLKIEGPAYPMAFALRESVVFRLLTPHDECIGTIIKERSSLIRELFTTTNYFSVSFPIDLDPKMKTTCLGAVFLIDYKYFESKWFSEMKEIAFG